MKCIETVLGPVIGMLCLACAGTLDDPSQFEQQLGNAEGDDQTRVDGGTGDDNSNNGNTTTPVGDGDGDGDGDAKDDAGAAGPKPVSCDFNALIAEKCGNCHGASGPSAGLDLTSDGLF